MVMARVSILWLSLTAGGWLPVLFATQQNALSRLQTEAVQASETSTSSSTVTSMSKTLNDDLSPAERSSNRRNKSRNVEVSSSAPQAKVSTSHGSTRRTLPNFPSTISSPIVEPRNSLVLFATASATLNGSSSRGPSSAVTSPGHWQQNSQYMNRWLAFYVKIGGWIMLAVILCGIISLVFTHIQAKRELRNAKDLPLLTRREQLIAQHKASWI